MTASALGTAGTAQAATAHRPVWHCEASEAGAMRDTRYHEYLCTWSRADGWHWQIMRGQRVIAS